MASESLSFDRHLRHSFAALSTRLECGIRALDGVIEMLRLRIEAEAQFATSLQKIISNRNVLSNLSPLESLRTDGLEAFYSDMQNEYTQRVEFLNSLNEEVYEPCVAMRELCAAKNRLFANDTKENIKSLRQQYNQFLKIKTKYDNICNDTNTVRTALINAKLDNKYSNQQILKLGSKVNNALKIQEKWKEKYDQQAIIWNKKQIKFDDEMTSILQGMQTNECNRMKTTKDSLNKWAVFTTNLCANRNYDVRNLADTMSLMDIEKDLQIFIQQTLKQYPSNNNDDNNKTAEQQQKKYQHAISNLNKTSQDKKINPPKLNRNQSLSHTEREQSTSFSISAQNEFVQDVSKRQRRQKSTSKSIGTFFKKKLQKQRSYNSPRSRSHHRENSNTISSLPDSDIYSPTMELSATPDIPPLNNFPTNDYEEEKMKHSNGNNNNNNNLNREQILISTIKTKTNIKMNTKSQQIIEMGISNNNDSNNDITMHVLEPVILNGYKNANKYDALQSQIEILNSDKARQQSLLLCRNDGFLKYLQTELNENIVIDIFNKSGVEISDDNILMASQFISIFKFTLFAYKTQLYSLQIGIKDKPKFDMEMMKTSIKHIAIWCYRTYGKPQNHMKYINVMDDNGNEINIEADSYILYLKTNEYLENIYKWIQKYIKDNGQR